MSRLILKAANSLVNLVVIIALFIAGTYAGYALWDNNRVYSAAGNVQADMIRLKPKIEITEEEEGASFDELLVINPDVCAWVTVDNTNIDFPVLQGETNLTYINTDVYGNFALAGSIFLDSRNARDYSEPYSLLYGHHMEKSEMFGDLELFKDQKFFDENKTGMLITPNRIYNLEIFACLLVDSGEDNIFDPTLWQTDIDGLLTFAEENSMYLRTETIEELRLAENPQVLALTTCSTEFTNARTIVLAVMEPYHQPAETADQEEK